MSTQAARVVVAALALAWGSPPSGAFAAYGDRTLAAGTRGGDVAELQRLLTRQGLSTPTTGVFDSRTVSNVKWWEAWQYRVADGQVPPKQAAYIRTLAADGASYVKRKHVFPIRGPHDYGSSGSRFGAPRSGHTHRGQDVSAAEGTKVVAVHNGRVSTRQYQDGGAGHYLVIRGNDASDSVYMHLRRAPLVEPGEYVRAGQRIGGVGCTGSCSGAHLHFELWTPHWYAGGEAYDPLAKLRLWDEQTP